MDSGGSGNDFVMYHLLFSNVFANNPVFEKSGIQIRDTQDGRSPGPYGIRPGVTEYI